MLKLPLGASGPSSRRSVTLEKTSPVESKGDYKYGETAMGTGTYRRLFRLPGGNSRFPRVEDMPHFHYDFVDLGESVKVSLFTGNGADKRYYNGNEEEGALL
ncbi:uncharacterized protein LOC144639663, partial [Oculina patagonica]